MQWLLQGFVVLNTLVLLGCAPAQPTTTLDDFQNYHQQEQETQHKANPATKVVLNTVEAGADGAVIGADTTVGTGPGAVGGAVVGGVISALIHGRSTEQQPLVSYGVHIIKLGDYRRIIIPSHQLFQGMSPKLKVSAYSLLNKVLLYLHKNVKVSVEVAAYSGNQYEPSVAKVLTQEQAQAVVNYLWPEINTRLIYPRGYGEAHQVSRQEAGWLGDANYRVEITYKVMKC